MWPNPLPLICSGQPIAFLIFQEVIILHNVSIVLVFPGKRNMYKAWKDNNPLFLNQADTLHVARQ